ncbi:hypothetical protein FE257_002785 [Aspergillus nanangensis]|uniref:RING-type domain-containing protein n=1 Tax=Aspergillus nanangensis TaxID=2582783 RepID=A0AAD4CC87_ASPNN|nr:hypothetical protein FE257_002785 [Aspergillus nanangensis]
MTSSTTAAKSLTTAATLFAGPGAANNATPAVNDSATFHFVLDGTVETLSTENSPDGPIKGLMFVPSLYPQDPCNDITAPFIPTNVTRLQDVSEFGYQTIGLAPWVSPDCTQAFLNASRQAGNEALVFFVPSNNGTKPPNADDPTWQLGDGGVWKTQNLFPVYAIPGAAGATLMGQLASYSGNSSPPSSAQHEFRNGSKSFNMPADIRLFTLIDLERGGDNSKMPSLWGFILAIVGTILVLSIVLLLCYQLVQKRRRENLQRRIEAGEADIENLGLHQLKVPQEVLDSIPVYIYPGIDALSEKNLSPEKADTTTSTDEIREQKEDHEEINPRQSESTRNTPSPQSEDSEIEQPRDPHELIEPPPPTPKNQVLVEKAPHSEIQPDITQYQCEEDIPDDTKPRWNRLSRSQTTCAICLDDFVAGTSTVRELPCGHIFHVECIDMSLARNSSLCPLCKKCVLPSGCWTVPVTNTMVHRDHVVRRSQ